MVVGNKKGKLFIFCWGFTYTFKTSLSDLVEKELDHDFKDTVSSTYDYKDECNTTNSFLLHWHLYSTQRFEFFKKDCKS